jgi:metal-responsive CopG/Arc/MetJ family transcriptional regulator
MVMVRTNITLPEELLRQVDELAGPRGRSGYIVDAVARKARSDLQRKVFEDAYEAAARLPGQMTDDEALAYAKELRTQW